MGCPIEPSSVCLDYRRLLEQKAIGVVFTATTLENSSSPAESSDSFMSPNGSRIVIRFRSVLNDMTYVADF